MEGKTPEQLLLEDLTNKIETSEKERETSLSNIRKTIFKADISRSRLLDAEDITTTIKMLYDVVKRLSDTITPVQGDLLNTSVSMSMAVKNIERILENLSRKLLMMEVGLSTIMEVILLKELATEEEIKKVCDEVVIPRLEEAKKEMKKEEEPKKEEEKDVE